MPISRLDLDGKGGGSPEGLVSKILKAKPSLSIPIPIEELCRELDIKSVEYHALDGIEGALITSPEREFGLILINETSHRFRQRFTMGHELGHFLIPTHMPGPEGRFMCSRADMLLQHASEHDRRSKMEVEANRFSALVLIPPPMLRPRLKGDPNLNQLLELAAEFEVSKEAMARAYSLYHDKLLAFVITHNGIIKRIYRPPNFPYITAEIGTPVPNSTSVSNRDLMNVVECLPDHWISVERGKKAPKLYEQAMQQRNNFAITMLWLEMEGEPDEDEFDRDEHLTAAQRLRDRINRTF
jgi:Zn-dependent peptidase ImmA (M78 family)